MGILQQWRYKIIFASIIAYMLAAFSIACVLLWNIAVGPNPVVHSQRGDSISVCGIDSKLSFDHRLNCSLIDTLTDRKFVAYGWTKVVYRAFLPPGNAHVAIKTVNSYGKDVVDCSGKEPGFACHNKAVDKLAKEIHLLRNLHHQSIIGLEYYCAKTQGLPESCVKQAVIVTEFGDPLTNIKLLQMAWKERRQVIQDLANLVDYVSNSPMGPLGLTDLRRPQCVLVQSRLKLIDLDDIVIGEPLCKQDSECSNLNISIPCISDHCHGYNAKLNIKKSFQEFGSYIFIPDGVPRERKNILKKLHLMWRDNVVTTKSLLSTAMSL